MPAKYAGLSAGLNAASIEHSQKSMRDAQLAEAYSRQQKASMELQEFKDNRPLRDRQNELKMQQLEAQTQTMNEQALHSTTMDAMERFDGSRDVKFLNNFLDTAKKNPVGSNIYGNIVRYDSITRFGNKEEIDKLLTEQGYNPAEVRADENLIRDFVVGTQHDGKTLLFPTEKMFAMTGYTRMMDNEKLEAQEKRARIHQQMQAGVPKHKIDLKERVVQDLIDSGKASSVAEAYQMLNEMEANRKGTNVLSTTEERAVNRIMEEDNVGYLEALDSYYSTKRQGQGQTDQSRFIEDYIKNNEGATPEQAAEAYRNLGKTSTQKQAGDITEIRKNLDAMKWLESKPSEMSSTERARVYRDYIGPLEDLRNFKFTTEEKREIRNLRNLTNLGKTAGEELTPDETGLLDNTLANFKKYMFNDVGGQEGIAAYETLRNVSRHVLFGSALTNNEIAAFNKSAGSLGQKFGPVMQQLKGQMETIKNNLESIRDTNDPDIAHYYMGMPIEEIDDVIANIDRRLEDPRLHFNKDAPRGTIKVQKGGKVEPNKKFDFDEAMKGAGL